MQIKLDRHNAGLKFNYCRRFDPPNFSLPSTFKFFSSIWNIYFGWTNPHPRNQEQIGIQAWRSLLDFLYEYLLYAYQYLLLGFYPDEQILILATKSKLEYRHEYLAISSIWNIYSMPSAYQYLLLSLYLDEQILIFASQSKLEYRHDDLCFTFYMHIYSMPTKTGCWVVSGFRMNKSSFSHPGAN